MIRDDIKHCMQARTETDNGRFNARFRFPASFTGFQGHFPDNPILPGLCILQAVLVASEAPHGTRASLRKIVSAKFYTAIAPDMDIALDGVATMAQNGDRLLKATLTNGSQKTIAKLTLLVRHEETP